MNNGDIIRSMIEELKSLSERTITLIKLLENKITRSEIKELEFDFESD